MIRERAGGEKADQLHDQVDPEQHADLLAKFGIDPRQLVSGSLGDVAGKLGL
jgi:hypothetical protein